MNSPASFIGRIGEYIADITSGVINWSARPKFNGNLAIDAGNLLAAQCYFQITSTTVCTLVRKGGSWLTINGVVQTIPTAGVTLAMGSLTASTLYYVYAYMNAGVMTLEASTTTHATDTASDIEIKSGDATRTLVGMVYPSSANTFLDSGINRMVMSFYNRRLKVAYGNSAQTLNSTSTSYVAAGTGASCLIWANDSGIAEMLYTAVSNGTAAASSFGSIWMDSSVPSLAGQGQVQPASGSLSGSFTVKFPLETVAEGFHSFQSAVKVSSGTGTFSSINNIELWG